ncbi:MAG TPA: GNAT family N-acetyltransferase [Devosia sp.]|nr:GNAT family N-acetyltransferase [Devosia sp.]
MAPSILGLETAMLSSWPSISSAIDGTWIARLARGYTRRSNSVNFLDPADGENAAERIGRMVDLYLLNSREPVFRITPLTSPLVADELGRQGFVREGDSHVLAMTLGVPFAEVEARAYDATDRNWLEAVGDLAGMDKRARELMDLLVGLIACRQAGLLIRDPAGEPAAAALAVVSGGIGCFHNVVVRPDRRGQGLGRAVMQAALNWTYEAGARQAALQVLADNAPAVRLYRSLGFEHAYDYHYVRQ